MQKDWFTIQKKVIFQKAEKSGRMRLIPFMQANMPIKLLYSNIRTFKKDISQQLGCQMKTVQ
jgi:hypothetical protein